MDETLPRVPGPDHAGEPTSSAHLGITVAPIMLDAVEDIPASGANPLTPSPDHPEQPAPVVISPADGLTSSAYLKITTFQLRWRQGESSP